MAVSSSFRADLRIAVAGLLDVFRVANPTLLRQTFRVRPRAFHPPLAYIGSMTESNIVHSQSLRTRTPRVDIVVVQGLYDNAESYDRQDVLIDALLDYLSNNPHAVSGATLIEPISTEDVDLSVGDPPKVGHYLATIVTVGTDTQEGLD